MSQNTYNQGYEAGFQEGIELMALAIACRLKLTVSETLTQVLEKADLPSLRRFLSAAGIPEGHPPVTTN